MCAGTQLLPDPTSRGRWTPDVAVFTNLLAPITSTRAWRDRRLIFAAKRRLFSPRAGPDRRDHRGGRAGGAGQIWPTSLPRGRATCGVIRVAIGQGSRGAGLGPGDAQGLAQARCARRGQVASIDLPRRSRACPARTTHQNAPAPMARVGAMGLAPKEIEAAVPELRGAAATGRSGCGNRRGGVRQRQQGHQRGCRRQGPGRLPAHPLRISAGWRRRRAMGRARPCHRGRW